MPTPNKSPDIVHSPVALVGQVLSAILMAAGQRPESLPADRPIGIEFHAAFVMRVPGRPVRVLQTRTVFRRRGYRHMVLTREQAYGIFSGQKPRIIPL